MVPIVTIFYAFVGALGVLALAALIHYFWNRIINTREGRHSAHLKSRYWA